MPVCEGYMNKLLIMLILLIGVALSGCVEESQHTSIDEHVTFNRLIGGVSEWGTNDRHSVDGTIEIYDEWNGRVRDTPIATIDITDGIGVSETITTRLNNDYFTLFNGHDDYYDAWLNSDLRNAFLHTADVGTGVIDFYGVKKVGIFTDPFDESNEMTYRNGYPNIGDYNLSGFRNNSNELQIGFDNTPANGDIIFYNKTNGDGYIKLIILIGGTGPYTTLKQPVIHFVWNWDNPLEGNEFKKVMLTQKRGDNYNIDGDYTSNANNAIPIKITDEMHTEDYSEYLLEMWFNEEHLDKDELIIIYLDDMGEYLGQDVARSVKAVVSDPIRIGVRE